MSRHIYIAGPMTGLPEFNYPAFEDAEWQLMRAGFRPASPHRVNELHGGEPGERTWQWYMRRTIRMLSDCDGVALLPGCEASKGARLEHDIATALDLPCRPVEDEVEKVEAEVGR
jgi:hypothetical protein